MKQGISKLRPPQVDCVAGVTAQEILINVIGYLDSVK